jgi:DNA segregation ATPase FtsK/SpoIIIE, S-DNA-T family
LARKRRFEQQQQGKPSHLKQDIIGILLIALALFIFLSTNSSNQQSGTTGLMGLYLVRKFLKPSIGVGVYFLPYFIGFFGVILMLRRQLFLLTVQIIGIILLFCTLISYGDGGYVGYVIKGGLEGTFGTTGAYIVLSSMFLISLILIFNITLTHAVSKLWDFIAKQLKNRPKKKPKPVEVADRRSIPSMIPVIKELNAATIEFEKEERKAPEPQRQKVEVRSAAAASASPRKLGKYELPPLDLLDVPTDKDRQREEKLKETIEIRKRALEETLRSFGIEASVVAVNQGPAVTRYEVQPEAGVKVSRIANLADDIALNLASQGVRIEAPIPGKAAVGIEVPNPTVNPVRLRDVVKTEEFQHHHSKLFISIGKDLSGAPIFGDLGKMPHLLIAGTTGSGKSVCINTLIISLLMRARPDEVKFVMIDPKMVELAHYNDIPHLLAPVVTDPRKAARTLKEWVLKEMDRRYKAFYAAGVRNLEGFNAKADAKPKELERLPYLVIIIDELADMMMVAAADVETTICRIAQMARATGIHLVIATQRPSVDVITGLIKANVPSRIAFAVATQVDSRVILDMAGAEKLLGRGDMLYHPIGSMKPVRLQGAFVSDNEVERITAFIKKQAQPEYSQEIIDIETGAAAAAAASAGGGDKDDLFAEAVKIIVTGGQASTSHLQRRLRIGYNRAARLMDEMEAAGIVSALEDDNKPRKITATSDMLKSLGIK